MGWWPWRFRGMIRPDLGVGFDDSRRIASRKSEAMVGYLRTRRAMADPTMWIFEKMTVEARSGYRQAHLRIMARKKAAP